MKTAQALLQGGGRLRSNQVLLRRYKPTTQQIDGPFSTEVAFEEHVSGIAISSPGAVITRHEVVTCGPKCKHLRPGDSVVTRPQSGIIGLHWHEDDDDFLLTPENGGDVMFRYKVSESTAEASAG